MALVQNSFNRYKTVWKKMTSFTKNEDKCSRIKDEFRILIIPLMQKAVNDNPSDLVSYCARYFEDLLMQREERIKTRENKLTTVSKEKQSSNMEESKNLSSHQKFKIHASSSLPVLEQKDKSFGPPLRETSSWNNPSNSSQTQKVYRRNIQFDVVDAMSQIGDQVDGNKAFKKRGDDDLIKDEPTMMKDDMKFSWGDKSKNEKNEHYNLEKGSRGTSYKENLNSNLSSIVDRDSNNSCSKQSTNNRKKWSKHDVVESPPGMKPELPKSESDTSSSDSDDLENSYERLRNDYDEKIESTKLCNVNTSLNSSFGFSPELHYGKVSQSKGPESDEVETKNSKVLSVEDIESLVESIFKTLRKTFEKELSAAESKLNLHLQRLKTLNGKDSSSFSPVPPRKKRSITTFSTSDKSYNSKERDKVSNDDSLLQGRKSKNSELNNNLGLDRSSNFIVKEESSMHDASATETSHKHLAPVNKLCSNQQNLKSRPEVENKSQTCRIEKKKDFATSEGFVNPGFSMEDECNDRAFMKRIHFIQKQFENNQRRTTEYLNNQKNTRNSSNLPPNRPSISRPIQSYRYNGRPSSYATPIIPNARISNVGEGDVLPSNQAVCSIGTETDNIRTTEHIPRTGDNVARILPIVDTASQNSRYGYRENADKSSMPMVKETGVKHNTTIDNSLVVDTKAERKGSNAIDASQVTVKINESKESNSLPKDSRSNDSKDNEIEKKRSNPVITLTKKFSNLNPCAPVFSPSKGGIAGTVGHQASKPNASSEIINRSEREGDRSNNETKPHNQLLRESDIRIDSVQWHYSRSKNSQGHEIAAISDPQNGCSSETRKGSPSCDFLEQNARNQEFQQNNSYDLMPNETKHPDASVMGNKDADSGRNDHQAIRNKSQLKMAEGDRIPFDQNGTKEKESSMISACGDFAPTENGSNQQPSSESERNNLGIDSNNLPALNNLPVSRSENDTGSFSPGLETSEKKPGEEIELNFACLSASDSSECYSSDMSEDEDFFEENFEK